MASAEVRQIAAQELGVGGTGFAPRMLRGRAAMRLLSAERSEEIFPVLLEEIVSLGFPRAFAYEVDLESGEIAPTAALNCSKNFLKGCATSLWAGDDPVVKTLERMQPEITKVSWDKNSWYVHPLIFRNQHLCWEAERDRRRDCLAVLNSQHARKLQLQEQVCGTCDMRAYVAAVMVEVPAGMQDRLAREIPGIVELANRYLSRLFKVEHYYNRMRDMETTIGQMETVMESMADPVILTDTHYRVIMQNRAAEKFFKMPEGVSEGGARAVEFNNLLFSAALSSMAISGTEASRDLTLVDVQEGEEVLFEAVCAPTYTREGIRTGMVTVMRDVTDLRRADQELRDNLIKLQQAEEVVRQDRDRLNVVIENVGDPIVVADKGAKVVLLDPLAKDVFGVDGAQQSDPELVKNQAKLDAYLTSFTFSFADRDSGPLRLYQPSSGGEVEYEARSGKVYDARGQVAFTVTVLRDFSAWKKLEQLKLERRMLEMEKFAATGRMAGTIAHEINNPMEAIKNAIELLNGQVKPKAEPVYSILKGETERVARIVRQMLGLYRSSERVGTMDVNSVVDDTLTLFARQLERAGITVTTDLGQLPPVTGSADQLRQVLSNLVVNARDSMAEGGRLRLRTRHLRSSDGVHGWVRITLVDSGSGIPANVLPTMFEPFVSTKGEKGTGLGLWIVKGIVESHGGKIRVRSIMGQGTLFQIEFPVVRA
ncbi:MAG TPA: ATP-binding protein [Terriglobales bacterium]|nr:ATP-binding protein [Terriglobales bacterium]